MLKLLFLFALVASTLSSVIIPLTPRSLDSDYSVDINNRNAFLYSGEIQIGTPPQSFNVTFDTGFPFLQLNSIYTPSICQLELSSCFNVSASKTSQDEVKQIDFPYYSATNDTGDLYEDTLVFAGVTLKNTEFLLTNASIAPSLLGGVFGLGLPSASEPSIEPIFSYFASQQLVRKVFSLFFTSTANQTGSSLMLGGYDSTIASGDFNYYTTTSNHSWQVPIGDFGYQRTSFSNKTTGLQGILASGAAQIIGAPGLFTELLKNLPSTIACTDINNYSSFYITFENDLYEIPPSVYYTDPYGSGTCGLNILDGSPSTLLQPGQILLGLPFFQTYYTSFDMDQMIIGVATPAQPKPKAGSMIGVMSVLFSFVASMLYLIL